MIRLRQIPADKITAEVIDPTEMTASIEALCANISDIIACHGNVVMLVRTVNGGCSARYSALEALGLDVVDALAESDTAYRVIKENQIGTLMARLDLDLAEESLIDATVTFFQMGQVKTAYTTFTPR